MERCQNTSRYIYFECIFFFIIRLTHGFLLSRKSETMPRTQRRTVSSSQLPCDEQSSSSIQEDSVRDSWTQADPIQTDPNSSAIKADSIQDGTIHDGTIQHDSKKDSSIQNALNEDITTDKVDPEIADKLDAIIGAVMNQYDSKEEESDSDRPIVPIDSLDAACASSVDQSYAPNKAKGANVNKKKGKHIEERRIEVKEGVWVELNETITKRAKELKSNFPNMSMEKAIRVCAKSQCGDGSKDGKAKPSSKSKATAKPSSKSKAIAKSSSKSKAIANQSKAKAVAKTIVQPSSIGASSSSTDLMANADSVNENTIKLLENIVGIKPLDGESDAKRLANVANRYKDCNIVLDGNHNENVRIVRKSVMDEFGSICKATVHKLWQLEINHGLRKVEDEYNSGEEFDKRTLRFVQETGKWSDKVIELIQGEGKFDKIVDEIVNLHNGIYPSSAIRM